MKKSIKEQLLLLWKGWGVSILVALVIATSFKSAIADWYVIPTGSMKPTILEGDRVFVNKLAYDLKLPWTRWHLAQWEQPQRGDIVVFVSPKDGMRLIKRVVGLPGDTVEMKNDQLILNGNAMTYEALNLADKAPLSMTGVPASIDFIEDLDGIRHPVRILPHQRAMRTFGPVTVPEGHFFMMGDNRDNSADSRYLGSIKRDLILGQAHYIVISLDINHHYRPRWERFFTALK